MANLKGAFFSVSFLMLQDFREFIVHNGMLRSAETGFALQVCYSARNAFAMPIEIKCRNFSNFDSATGKYVQCGEKLTVSKEQIGQFVSCTKCDQLVEVAARSGTSGSQQTKPRRQTKSSVNRKSSRPVRLSARASASNDGLQMAAPLKRERSDVMAMDFGEEQIESTLNEDQHDRCSKCGHISRAGKCTVCRHVEPNFDKRHQRLEEVEIELVGFQRWFCKTMSEGVPIRALEYGAHVGLGFIALGTTLFSILSIFGLAFGVVAGLVLLLLTLCATLLYIGLVFKGRQFRRDPRARLAWFQKPFWNALLLLARAMNWQHYDSNLKGRRITKHRGKTFGDVELADIEGLKNCQVLDLQDTSVTDATLQMLYGQKHLQCLVVKGADTTYEAVFRFQQSHPRLWIWE